MTIATVNVKSTEPAQDLKGQTINLYKLFDVTESGTTESKNYAYTVNTETGYKDAIKSALGTSFSGTTDEEYAAAVLALKDTEVAVQKFANDFTAEALTKNLSATANSGKITEENKTSYTFNNLAAGYYLVYVTGGKEIQSSLVTVDETTTTVNLKTEAPSIEKTADKTTVNIGDVVTYNVKAEWASPETPPNNPDKPKDPTPSKPDKPNPIQKIINTVKTGDTTNIVAWFLIAIVSLGLIVGLYKKRKMK